MAGNKLAMWISRIALIAGGIEIGIQSFFGYDLLGTIFGGYAKWVLYLIGLSALYAIYSLYKHKEM